MNEDYDEEVFEIFNAYADMENANMNVDTEGIDDIIEEGKEDEIIDI